MANEENQSNTRRGISNTYRFWFAVVFTAFLAVTFGLYLPMRFQYKEITHDMGGQAGHMMADNHAGHGVGAYHEEADIQSGLSVDLSYDLWPPEGHPLFGATSTKADLNFYVNQKPERVLVPISDLETEHTKLMHVIGIRDDMNEFFHIHPRPVGTSSVFTVRHTFEKPGRYKLWSQIKKDGVVHAFGHPAVEIQGVGDRSSKEVSLNRSMIVENYQVAFKPNEPVIKGVETPLSFDIRTRTGQNVEVEPYLGADMHLAVIKDDLTQFIHTHPEGHEMDMSGHNGMFRVIKEAKAHGVEEENPTSEAADKTIDFHVVFPEPGLYKAFAQFRPRGSALPHDDALTASFWLRVAETPPLKLSKGALVLISLVFMAILSLVLKRFLAVRA